MSKPTDHDTDAIDDMIAGVTGFLGVILERGRPRYVGVRALVESTVYALVEHMQATQPAPRSGVSPVDVAALLYEFRRDLWASDIAQVLVDRDMVPESGDEALAAWVVQQRAAEKAALSTPR